MWTLLCNSAPYGHRNELLSTNSGNSVDFPFHDEPYVRSKYRVESPDTLNSSLKSKSKSRLDKGVLLSDQCCVLHPSGMYMCNKTLSSIVSESRGFSWTYIGHTLSAWLSWRKTCPRGCHGERPVLAVVPHFRLPILGRQRVSDVTAVFVLDQNWATSLKLCSGLCTIKLSHKTGLAGAEMPAPAGTE